MIDLGLTKLALIGGVALIVIGPKDLPKVARMAGTLLGRAQRYMSQIKAEVSREIELDELRKMQSQVQTAAQEMEQSIGGDYAAMQSEVQSALTANLGDVDNHPHWPYHSSDGLMAFAAKAKSFRRKKMHKNANIPNWYKSRHGQHERVLSGAARMHKHRAASKSPVSFY